MGPETAVPSAASNVPAAWMLSEHLWARTEVLGSSPRCGASPSGCDLLFPVGSGQPVRAGATLQWGGVVAPAAPGIWDVDSENRSASPGWARAQGWLRGWEGEMWLSPGDCEGEWRLQPRSRVGGRGGKFLGE